MQRNRYRHQSLSLSRLVPRFLAGLALLAIAGVQPAMAQVITSKAPEYDQVDIEEHLGATIPLDLEFTGEQGEPVRLGDLFAPERPLILLLAYYECPMLCTLVLNGVSAAVAQMPLEAGRQYRIVTVSIDPEETPALALAKQQAYVKAAGGRLAAADWRFLVGKQAEIDRLTDAVGFRYEYVPATDQYSHPAVMHILTGDGRISRYLYGIKFDRQDVKLALLEASRGNIGTIVDRFILFCYHYDPKTGQYTLFAENLMRLGGAVTMVLMALFLGLMWYREKHHRSSSSPTPST